MSRLSEENYINNDFEMSGVLFRDQLLLKELEEDFDDLVDSDEIVVGCEVAVGHILEVGVE